MGWWWETPVQTLNSSGFYSLHPGMHSFSLLLSVRMHVCTKWPWQMKIKLEMTRLLQDQHLHNFFQHCQNMEMSEQASEGELVKYLKVLKATFIWNAPRKSQHTLLFMSYQTLVWASRPSVAHFSMWHYSFFVRCQQISPAASWALLECFGRDTCKHLTHDMEII